MKIETEYWKTDKIAPSNIKKLIHNTCESVLYDLLYSYEGSRRAKSDDDGITFGVTREYIMSRNGMDSSNTEMWEAMCERDPAKIVVDSIFSDRGQFPKKLDWATNDILESFLDYMGLLQKAKDNSSIIDVPYGQSLRYNDDMWESLHDEEE